MPRVKHEEKTTVGFVKGNSIDIIFADVFYKFSKALVSISKKGKYI